MGSSFIIMGLLLCRVRGRIDQRPPAEGKLTKEAGMAMRMLLLLLLLLLSSSFSGRGLRPRVSQSVSPRRLFSLGPCLSSLQHSLGDDAVYIPSPVLFTDARHMLHNSDSVIRAFRSAGTGPCKMKSRDGARTGSKIGRCPDRPPTAAAGPTMNRIIRLYYTVPIGL